MKKQYRKSDLNILNDGNVKLLTNTHRGLFDCEMSIITEENIELIYKPKGTSLQASNYKKYEQLQILYRLAILVANDLKKLDFSLSPSNVYVLTSGDVCICERKISTATSGVREARLLNELIALCGYLIENIDYQSLLEVNSTQLESKKSLKGILEVTTLLELCDYLEQKVASELDTLHKERVIISKTKYKNLTSNKLFYRISLIVTIILIIILCGYLIPLKSTKIELYEAVQNSDSTKVLDIVQDINIKTMSKTEKVVASITIINDQVELNNEQKLNVISQIDSKTKEEILNYWLYIGKGEYDQANNSAISVSDADMQIYALLLLINQTQNDEELEASERKELISSYESQIDELKIQKQEVNGELDE